MQAELTGTPASDETSDAVLLLRTREGDTEAFGGLYLRHVAAARVLARQLARDPSEADELVAESFTRVLGVLQRGAGPEAALRPYLLSTLRRLHIDRRMAEKKTEPTDDLTPHDQGQPFVDLPADELERSIVSTAFGSLPERWRLVLWHSEVEGLSPAQVSPLLGISANATAALAVRARAGLRDAYLSAHVTTAGEPGCREIGASLGGYVRGTLSRRERVAVDTHLDSCARCSAAVLELSDTAATMRGVIGPLILGAAVLGYREGVLALGPHAIPSATMLQSGGAAALHGGSGAGGSGAGGGASGAGGSGASGGGGGGGVAGNAARPTWQLITAAGVAGAVVIGAALAFAIGGGSPNRASAGGPTSGPTAAVPTAGPSSGATPSPSSAGASPSSSSTGPSPTSAPTTAPVAQPSPTTAAATPTPTPTPSAVPVAAPTLDGNLMAVGDLVQGRDGYLTLRSRNPGAGSVSQTISLHLPAGVSFNPAGQVTAKAFTGTRTAAPATFVAAASAAATATATATATSAPCTATADGVTCRLGTLAAGASKDFVVPVSVGTAASDGAWSGTLVSSAGVQSRTTSVHGTLAVSGDMGVNAMFAAQGRYQVSGAGNALMSCQDPDPKASPDPKCASVERSRGPGPLTNDPGQWTMFTRNDLGAGWQNSSTAHLALPAGSTVGRAWLTWSAVGAGPASTQPADLAAPGGQPVSLKTDQVVPIKVSDQSGYVAVADVTDAVAAGGSGDWTAGNITLADKPGNQLYAGWSLIVVTTSPTAPVQNITVLAGPHLLSSGTDWTGHALGLRGGAADLLMVAWEGDAGHTGDSLSVHGQALNPRDGMSDNDDAAASSSLGALTRDGTAQELTFGVDVRAFEAPRDGADQHGDITLGTNGDNYVLGLLAVTTGDGLGEP